MILNEIIEELASSRVHKETRETESDIVIKFRVSGMSPDKDRLVEKLRLVNYRDSYKISIDHDNSDQSTSLTEGTAEAIEEFCNKISLWNESFGSLEGVLTLRVNKSAQSNALTIYSLDKFSEYLVEGSIVDCISKLRRVSEAAYALESPEITETSKTELFVFKPPTSAPIQVTNPESARKQNRLGSREKACSIYGIANYSFLPNDFRFEKPFSHATITETFKKLETLHSIISLSDLTKFEPNGAISISLKGYSTVKFEAESLKSITTDSTKEYFEIFEWAYTDGNIVDKIGISRNLISIHTVDDNLLKLKPGCIESIKSNYTIYLKDNLKQYIEVKNKLSDQIQKTTEKAAEVVKAINNYLRTSIFSVYSFVFSVFLIRSLSKSDSGQMFSSATYGLFILLILISIIVLCYAISETNAEIRRFKKNYNSFRQRYTDLITKEDLNRIFSNDKDFERDIDFIKSSRRKAVTLWLSSLTIIFLVITTIKFVESRPPQTEQSSATPSIKTNPSVAPKDNVSKPPVPPTLPRG